MNGNQAHALAITVGLFALAGLFLWRGDNAHAMLCVIAAVPNAQQFMKAPPPASLTALVGELEAAAPRLQALVSSVVASATSPAPAPAPLIMPSEAPTSPATPSALTSIAAPVLPPK
jgi:hypothetical protein